MAENQEKRTLQRDLQKLVEQGMISEEELYGDGEEGEEEDDEEVHEDEPGGEELKEYDQNFDERDSIDSGISILPLHALDDPFVIPFPEGSHPWFCPINAPLVGLARNADPVTHALRNALLIARAARYPLIIITGNLIHLDVTRAGSQQGQRAYASIALDSGNLFETIDDRIAGRVALLREQFLDQEGNSIFNGPIYVTFGKSEKAIYTYWVNERVNQAVEEVRQQIAKECDELAKRKKELEKELKAMEKTLLEGEVGSEEKILSAFREAKQELQNVEEAMQEKTLKRKIVKATNISEAKRKEWILEAQQRLIDLIEAMIPWIKVIATNKCVVKIGERTVLIDQNPRESIADTYADKVQEDLRLDLKTGKSVPDLVLIAGYNVAGMAFQVNYPRSEEDPRETKKVEVIQLPMCVDSSFLQKLSDLSVGVGPFLTRLVGVKHFIAGMIVCRWISRVFETYCWYERDLSPEPPKKGEQPSLAYRLMQNHELLEKFFQTSFMVYGEWESDMQEGGKQQGYYEISDPPFLIAPYDFHHQVFLRNHFPLSWGWNLGDIVQGENHAYHLEVPESYLEPHKLGAEINRLFASNIPLEGKLVSLAKTAIRNAWRIGIQRVDDQLDQYMRTAYKKGSEYYARILRKCKNISLAFVGKATAITILGGNHFANTEGIGTHSSEATRCAEALQNILRDYHRFGRDEIKKLVSAPLGSARTVSRALGAMGILRPEDRDKNPSLLERKAFPYCVSAKHKPGRGGARTAIPVRKMRMVRMRIGVTTPVMKGRFLLEGAGHIDRKSWCMIPNGFLSISPGQEFQGPFAEEEDFPLADMGTVILGLPMPSFEFTEGYEVFGPIVHMTFSYEDVFYPYSKNPWEFDVAALFPNAL